MIQAHQIEWEQIISKEITCARFHDKSSYKKTTATSVDKLTIIKKHINPDILLIVLKVLMTFTHCSC